MSTYKVLTLTFLLALFCISAAVAGSSFEQTLPTPDMVRTYNFFNYLANGVPTQGYNASPYLPEGMAGIGQEASKKIWGEARKEYSGGDVEIFASATLSAASNLYGEHSTVYNSVKNAWTALNVATTTSITITNPVEGMNWVAGSKHTIRWNYTGTPGSTVKILLLRGPYFDPSYYTVITSSTAIGSSGKGSYNWTIPCVGTFGQTGTDSRKILVISNSNSSYKSLSKAFNTVRQTITVTSPAEGTTWPRDSTQTIKWTYTGDIGPTVDITYGYLYVDKIAYGVSSGSAGAGSFNWYIPYATPLSGQTGGYVIITATSCGNAVGISGYFNTYFP